MPSPSSLNVIALISGGKDSLFNILHCLENGHRVVALANLYPRQQPIRVGEDDGGNGRSRSEISVTSHRGENDDDDDDPEGEDINSFMYQTVGYSVIPLYAECLGIPVYRREITGSAVQTGRYYDASNLGMSSDETEDLIPLLQEVMREHPDANALCSGAILSTYQRTRVESIAVRLGLTPLAYLWQYPALPPPDGRGESLTGLLDDMEAAGCDARIIKIASGGIKESLLWSNVADPRTRSRLVNGLRPFFSEHEFWLRGAVLGEGGEYETLAVNGPRRLWKKRIETGEDQNSILSAEGGVSYLRLAKVRAVENDSKLPDHEAQHIRIPHMFDAQFQSVLTTTKVDDSVTKRAEPSEPATRNVSSSLLDLDQNLTPTHLSISNLVALSPVGVENSSDVESQTKDICNRLNSILHSISETHSLSRKLTTSNIVSTTLLLKDMASFGRVNSIYSSLFLPGEPNPPARVTIACPLPDNVEVSLSVILDLGARDVRRGLHVQSRSYWAPANIGPYSQAICVPLDEDKDLDVNVHDAGLVEMVHMAGQIPLVPQSMEILQAAFPEQAVLSLQHLWRAGQEREVDLWPWGVAFLKRGCDVSLQVEMSCKIWQAVHEIGTRPKTQDFEDDAEGPDAWDLQYNRASGYETFSAPISLGDHLHVLPNLAVLDNANFVPPFIAAEVETLPRDASVEWWSLGITNLPKIPSFMTRVSVSGRNYRWGSVTDVTIHPSRRAEESVGPHMQASVHLVTVLVGLHGLAYGFDVVEEDLTSLIMQQETPDRSAAVPLQMVHGTGFFSTAGQTQRSSLREGGLLTKVSVIPCRSLRGRSQSLSTVDAGGAGIAGDESGGISSSTGVSSLSPSMLIERGGAYVKGESALCQPLAAALTLRIDQNPNPARTV